MRISDWSSDVCSSDLMDYAFCNGRRNAARCPPLCAAKAGAKSMDGRRGAALAHCARSLDFPVISVAVLDDRKSVVQGKSVSVRVDLVGRSILKKNKTSPTSSCLYPTTINSNIT